MDLFGAAVTGDVKTLHFLLESGENPNQQNDKGWTALMIACCHGYVDFVEELLKHNADVSIQDEDGWTALMCCSRYNHPQVIKLILDQDQNIDISNKSKMTALTLAASENKKEAVELLAPVSNIRNRSHALLFAAGKNYPAIVDILLEYNINLDYTRDGYSAFDLARSMKNTDILIKLYLARSNQLPIR